MEQPHSIALLVPEIKELLASRNYALLKSVIRESNALDFADSWHAFTEAERLHIFRLLPATSALKLFEILDVEDQRYLLERASDDSVFAVLEGADAPDLAKVFHKLSPRALKKMTSLMKRQDAISRIDYLMTFPPNTAGSLMHPEFVKLSPKLTAKQALLRLQVVVRPNQKDLLNSLYVTDDEGKVLGAVNLSDMITAPEDVRLGELMESVEGLKIRPETDQEEVSKLFSKYQANSAPVVDESGKLLGVLSVKDIISIVKQEATEDIAKMAGTRAEDVVERSVIRTVRLRMPWLLVTLGAGTIVSMIIRHFEPVLSQVIALASFSPLIAGMGGNAGSQSATVTVRSIALGNLNRQKKIGVIFREFGAGLCMGSFYGAALGFIAYLVYGPQYGPNFSIVVGSAMCTAMTIAATMGALGPMLFDRIGVDPATAAGPIVTTTTDIVSNFIYFTMATVLLFKP
jgi:magnesium transporter